MYHRTTLHICKLRAGNHLRSVTELTEQSLQNTKSFHLGFFKGP